MTYTVGLTGGIGSGKTLISDRLAALGVPVVDTDIIARQVVAKGQPALAALTAAFGVEILLPNGELNRDRLRQLAFADAAGKRKLDAITHPAIRLETMNQVSAVDYPYCVVVIPLLTADSAFSAFLHRVLAVTCATEIRIARVMRRNSLPRSDVERIVNTQLSDEERLAFADDVIENSGTKESAIAATDALHHQYLDLSQALTKER